MMIQANNRYFVEHKALPDALYSRGDALLKTMMNDEGKAMEKFYRHSEGHARFHACHYKRSAFALSFREYINGRSSVFIVGIKMPQPQRVLQCKAVYLCYGDGDENTLYITSELYKNGRYGLCVQTRNNVRRVYASTSADEFDAVAKVYWDFTCGGGRKLIPQIIKANKLISA